MKNKIVLIAFFLSIVLNSSAQKSKLENFKQLSCPEKWWVIGHPFVAKKAFIITEQARRITKIVMQEKLLMGNGNSGQIDAFRHTFWLASLTQQMGWRKAKKLGKAHEKGNFITYKKQRLEDGVLPDKISSEMDLFNNNIGIAIGKMTGDFELKLIVLETIKEGKCKIIKKDSNGNFLDCKGTILSDKELNGKWENDKCLVWSNEL